MTTSIVIPCFNEAKRLSPAEIETLLTTDLRLYLVDDGSTDGTLQMLQGMRFKAPDRVTVVSLPGNAGKGEAVRQGMSAAIEDGAGIVGYLDADFATPAEEMLRLIGLFPDLDVRVLLASRWSRLGIKQRLFCKFVITPSKAC